MASRQRHGTLRGGHSTSSTPFGLPWSMEYCFTAIRTTRTLPSFVAIVRRSCSCRERVCELPLIRSTQGNVPLDLDPACFVSTKAVAVTQAGNKDRAQSLNSLFEFVEDSVRMLTVHQDTKAVAGE